MSDFWARLRFWRDHRWAPSHMSAYLDGELAQGRRARMERHTVQCHECRRLLEGLRRLLGALQRLPPPNNGIGSVELADSVRQRLSEPPAS